MGGCREGWRDGQMEREMGRWVDTGMDEWELWMIDGQTDEWIQ